MRGRREHNHGLIQEEPVAQELRDGGKEAAIVRVELDRMVRRVRGCSGSHAGQHNTARTDRPRVQLSLGQNLSAFRYFALAVMLSNGAGAASCSTK